MNWHNPTKLDKLRPEYHLGQEFRLCPRLIDEHSTCKP